MAANGYIDIRRDVQAILDAIRLLESRYPGYTVRLVPDGTSAPPTPPAQDTAVDTSVSDSETDVVSNSGFSPTNQQLVLDSLAKGWKRTDTLAAETGLEKKQIYAVVNAKPNLALIEKREIGRGREKEYRLKTTDIAAEMPDEHNPEGTDAEESVTAESRV